MNGPKVSKIYYNQEITVNYRPEEIRSSMKKSMELYFKLYKKWILKKSSFIDQMVLDLCPIHVIWTSVELNLVLNVCFDFFSRHENQI